MIRQLLTSGLTAQLKTESVATSNILRVKRTVFILILRKITPRALVHNWGLTIEPLKGQSFH